MDGVLVQKISVDTGFCPVGGKCRHRLGAPVKGEWLRASGAAFNIVFFFFERLIPVVVSKVSQGFLSCRQ